MRARLLYVVSALAVAASAGSPLYLTLGQSTVAAAAEISAIGNEAPIAIVASPSYATTGMVVAVAVPVGGCSRSCLHLWTTHDGGATWHIASTPAPGSDIAVVAGGHGAERLVATSPGGVVASDDDGATWHVVGPVGIPAPAPPLGSGAVLVAGERAGDYALDGDSRRTVPGSGGADVDLAFGVVHDGHGKNVMALLAARDRSTGLPVVLRCDADLSCSGAAHLPGATPSSSGDMSLLLAPDFSSGGPAYVRTANELYRSDDGGRTFLAMALPPHPGAHYATIPGATLGGGTPHAIDVALFDVFGGGAVQPTGGGVFTSSDRGVSWHGVASPSVLDGGATAVAAAPGGRLFAGYVDGHGDAGLVCSDGGAAWQASCAAPVTSCPHRDCTGTPMTGGPPAAARVSVAYGSNAETSAGMRPPPLHGAHAASNVGDQSVTDGRAAPFAAGALVALVALVAVRTRRRRLRRLRS